MTIRERTQSGFQPGSKWLWLLWAVVPGLVLVLGSAGSPLAGLWVLLVMWLGRQPLSIVGLRRPRSLLRLVSVALGLAVPLWAASTFVIGPLAKQIPHSEVDFTLLDDLPGNWPKLFLFVAFSWFMGGFLEEIAFRGFLLHYGVRLLGERWLWPLAALGAVVFGFGHLEMGVPMAITVGIGGFMLAAIFVLCRRDLLLVMLVHGFVNTLTLVRAFMA